MPNPATPNMGLIMPTEGSDAGTWGATLNDAGDRLDLHDHSSGLGVKVKTNGLDINADLTMASGGTYSAITNAKGVDFQPHAASAMTAYAGCLFTNSSDSNNLYFRTQAGSNVRITNGATLDTTTSGGIGGDYASIPAEVAYVDASDTYTFRQTAAGNWARLQSGPVRISELGTTETQHIEIAAPTALASSYTITPATALPGSTQLVQISSAGALTYSNTVANAVSMSSTLGVTGLITATAGVTAASGQHVTVSGAGRHKHGDMVLHLDPYAGFSNSLTGTSAYGFNSLGVVALVGAADLWNMALPFSEGHRIRSIVFYYQRSGGTVTFNLQRRTLSTGATSNIATNSTASGTSYTNITVSAIDYTVVSTETPFLQFRSGAAGDIFAGATITYDLP